MRLPAILHPGRIVPFLGLLSAVNSALAAPGTYDPLAVSGDVAGTNSLTVVRDTARDRDIPLKLYWPPAKTPAPVILFSHGLGGSRENGGYLGKHWSARGYVAIFMQHPGSDESVWKDQKMGNRVGAMRQAASGKNLKLRLDDVPAVLDQLTRWNADANSPCFGRLDLKHIGMSGHSFGAVTTQGVSGQSYPVVKTKFTDSRITAACAFSPSSPKQGPSPAQSFGSVKIPWMLMTGTEDVSPINDTDVASRLAVFPALPPGAKYELVLDGATHGAFGDRGVVGDKDARNPNHHRAILALSTAFWDTYLKGSAEAKAWLDGAGPRTILEPRDKWSTK